MIYCRDHGIDVLWKLSQRFVIDIPQWHVKTLRQMGKCKAILSSAPCYYNSGPRFAFRTECVGLLVEKWCRPDILKQLEPRRLGYACEGLFATLFMKLGRSKGFHNPDWLGRNREEWSPHYHWKDTVPKTRAAQGYMEGFAKYKIIPGEDFHVDHSCSVPGFKWG